MVSECLTNYSVASHMKQDVLEHFDATCQPTLDPQYRVVDQRKVDWLRTTKVPFLSTQDFPAVILNVIVVVKNVVIDVVVVAQKRDVIVDLLLPTSLQSLSTGKCVTEKSKKYQQSSEHFEPHLQGDGLAADAAAD